MENMHIYTKYLRQCAHVCTGTAITQLEQHIKNNMTGLKVNQTTSRPITLAGKVDNRGMCQGALIIDSYGSWTDVVVLANIKITIQEYKAKVKLNTNQIILRSGVHCDLKSGQCADIEG